MEADVERAGASSGSLAAPARLAAAALASALLLAACGGKPSGNGSIAESSKVVQTRFPGQVTAGGESSGVVMAQAKPAGGAKEDEGTPGIPQGSGGNTGGAALGGTTGGSPIGGTGQKSPEQAASAVLVRPSTGASATAPAASAASESSASAASPAQPASQ